MTFFNQDEETISIELTKHGRELLSLGKLKPMFYSFSDDDILYDSQKGGFSEENSAMKNRILNETPRMKPIASKNIESDLSNMVGHEDYDNGLKGLIGTVNQNNTLASPSWDATLLKGEIVSATNSLSSIATVDCVMEYSMSFGRITGNDNNFNNFGLYEAEVKPDGSYLKIEENNFLLHLTEKNTNINKENFDIEVYLYENDEQTMNQLFFARRDSNIINDMYVEDVEEEIELTPDHVEFYFDVFVDREIPDEVVCEGIRDLKNENVYLDYDIKCPDREPAEVNIYSSDLEDPEEC